MAFPYMPGWALGVTTGSGGPSESTCLTARIHYRNADLLWGFRATLLIQDLSYFFAIFNMH